jgi:RNA polymerase sigma factor (sigma-70 family)
VTASSGVSSARSQDSAEEVFASLERLIASLARKYDGIDPAVSYSDLQQELRVAALEAWERYDTSKKMQFSTWAVWHMKKHLEKLFRREALVEVLDRETGQLLATMSPHEWRRAKQHPTLIGRVTYRFRRQIVPLEDECPATSATHDDD